MAASSLLWVTTHSVAVPPAGIEAASPAGTEAASTSGKKGAALVLATVLTLGAAGAWGYTQWWTPRQEAQQAAQAKYQTCLDEVKVYEGTASYQSRVDQCATLHTGANGG